ncbi:MAG: SUF system NifU family Fe-S cluster assembly protein [Candidatus Omnitrophica bacterium]|nr:SUF system NifU family Fe-S cluster assembly protein [Candidatus Omnitrophota bacterium]
MADLNELYQEMILEHNTKPRNFRAIADASRKTEGYNPLCGDRITLFLKMENGRVADISFQGSGCAISKASASMMTTVIKGKTKPEAEALADVFRRMVSSGAQAAPEAVGKLAVFAGVSEFPARVKCATLAWHTLLAGLEEKTDHPVTTEGENGS